MWGEGTESLWKLPSNSFARYLVAKVIVNLHPTALTSHSQQAAVHSCTVS